MGRSKSVYTDLPDKMTARPSKRGLRYFFSKKDGGKVALGYDITTAKKKLSVLLNDENKKIPNLSDRQLRNIKGEAKKLYSSCLNNARSRGITFSLTRQDVIDMLESSFGVCDVTGILFDLAKRTDSHKRPFAPSIDRIDQSKGYSIDNCRIVCVSVNLAMNEWGEDVLSKIAFSYVGKVTGQPVPNPNQKAVESAPCRRGS